jgi:hypothetical protein
MYIMKSKVPRIDPWGTPCGFNVNYLAKMTSKVWENTIQ